MNSITGLYSATIKFLKPDGDKTGIFKTPIETATLDKNGIVGDIQVDKRFHGGPEKALHQYALSSYPTIIDHFPHLEGIAIAGSIGENISSNNLEDSGVFIGDIYQIGHAVIQISQPRRPCWKINRKFDTDLLAKFIANHCITGWYYRILETGNIKVGDNIELVKRHQHSISINELTRLSLTHRPDLETLNKAIQSPGLNQQWQSNLKDRFDYLQNLG